jgi:hypothetical protein
MLSITCLYTVVLATNVHADIEADTAVMSFVVPITISNPINVNFGSIGTNIVKNQLIILKTDDSIAGSGKSYHLGGQNHGSLDIQAAPQQINIYINGFSNNHGTVFDLKTPTCQYGNGQELKCSKASNYSINPVDTGVYTLNIGMKLKALAPIGGIFTESFVVNTLYN